MARKNYPRETRTQDRKLTTMYINRPYLKRLGFTDWQIDELEDGDYPTAHPTRRVKTGVNIRK